MAIEWWALSAAAVLFCLWLYAIRLYGLVAPTHSDSHFRPLFTMGPDDRRTECVVALTIDDAPYDASFFGGRWRFSTSIDEMGRVLADHGCSATLLIIGSYLEAASATTIATLRRMRDRGTVEFANHGYTNSAHAQLGLDRLEDELVRTEALLEERLGQPTRRPGETAFYRPGCGRFHEGMVGRAALLGYRILLGDVYSFDPQIPLWWLHWLHVMLTVRPGSIVILHDRPWTPVLLRFLLPALRWRGYDVCMLSEALAPPSTPLPRPRSFS
jgi:peptidoglycan/xylan/chitin deacetylase (PgdA/CDA1 family)